MSKERKILVALLVVAIGFLAIDKFVLSDDIGASPPPNSAVTPARATNARNQPNRPSPRQPLTTPDLEQGYRPLPLQALKGGRASSRDSERNVFVYYVPPPPPPPVVPPPPPPPITIYSLDPSSVFAKTKDFTLRVSGQGFPEDAQIFVRGTTPLKTSRASARELNATVEKRLIAAPGQLQVEVKNATGELYSNPLFITINDPPTPPYTYIGRIDNLVYLQKGPSDRLLARLGQTVEDRWRVAQVGSENVVLEDVLLGIPYTIAMEERGASVASGQPVGGFPTPVQRTFTPTRRPPIRGVEQPQPGDPNPTPAEEEEP
jgi:hypothetical protein